MKFFSYICNCVALDTGMCVESFLPKIVAEKEKITIFGAWIELKVSRELLYKPSELFARTYT